MCNSILENPYINHKPWESVAWKKDKKQVFGDTWKGVHKVCVINPTHKVGSGDTDKSG
jgi:hypothetical protein